MTAIILRSSTSNSRIRQRQHDYHHRRMNNNNNNGWLHSSSISFLGYCIILLLMLFMQHLSFSNNFVFVVVVNAKKSTIVNVRTCNGPKHITLAVGHDPSTSMIISFASYYSIYPAPIAGVLLSTNQSYIEQYDSNPESINYHTNQDDTFVFLEESSDRFSSPTSYNVKAQKYYQANAPGDLYYSAHYHHIMATNLRPSTRYYYKLLAHTHMQSYAKYKPYLRTSSSSSSSSTGTNSNQQQQQQSLSLLSTTHFYSRNELLNALNDADVKMLSDWNTYNTKQQQQEYNNENSDDDDNDDDLIRKRRRQRRRQLVQWGPYDPAKHDCPDPNELRYFQTAPAQPSSDDEINNTPISFAIIGDLGQFPHSQETALNLLHNQHLFDTILLAGDLAYTEYDHRRWDTFMDFLDDYEIAHYKPMQIVPGNHDIDKLSNDRNLFLAYENRFRMPSIQQPVIKKYDGPITSTFDMERPPYPLPYEYGNAYYSYTYGSVYVLMISSYSSLETDSIQYKWIVNELQNKINRNKTPWVIAVLHSPMYNTFGVHFTDRQMAAAKEHLEPLFIQYDVNMIFTGHIHAYLRTTNVEYEIPTTTGPIHITVGAGGRNCDAPFRRVDAEPWVAVRDASIYGYGMLRILNSTHSEWEWIHTGLSDYHATYNELYHSNITLPAGPDVDKIIIENQYYIKKQQQQQP